MSLFVALLVQDRIRRYDSFNVAGKLAVGCCEHFEDFALFIVECALADRDAMFGIGHVRC